MTFSTNGNNSAKTTTATFIKAGTYNFQVTITDAGGLTTQSNVAVTVQPPTVATAAQATPGTVTGTTTALSVLGADAAGENHLTYTWSSVGGGNPGVNFSVNGNNSSKNTTATFQKAGTYTLQVTITNAANLSVTSSVVVIVSQTYTSATITPTPVTLNENGTQQFTATALDQFGNPMATQPAVTWSSTGLGSISSSGLYTGPGSGSIGSATVTATSSDFTVNAPVTITNAVPTIAHNASAPGGDVQGTTVALSVLGADDGGEPNLTYTWTTIGTPPAPVSYSVNGTNSAKNTTVTFYQAGSYSFQVTVTDVFGASVTSTLNLNVHQTSTTLTVSPGAPTVSENEFQQFSGIVYDQFGLPLAQQPNINWSLSGSGLLTNTGLYLAPATLGTATVRATANNLTGNASITIAAPGPINVPTGLQTTVIANSPGNNPITTPRPLR